MKKELFGLQLNVISKAEVLDEVIACAKSQKPSYLCAVNAHMASEAQRDHALLRAVNSANWAVTDGMPVAWAFNRLNRLGQERIAGMDITPLLIQKAASLGLVVSIFGNTKNNLKSFKSYVSRHYPALKIGELISPPFRPLTNDETELFIEKINKARTNILFVSLGCPKQEKWMLHHAVKVNAVCLGIGNAVNTLIGVEKRPPNWVQRLGMEWFYRLAQNPKRLFKRYLITNTKFIVLFFRDWLGIKRHI